MLPEFILDANSGGFSYHPHYQASESTNAGNFDEARQYGRMALWFNLGTFAYYAVFIVVTVIAVAVVVSSHSRYDDFPDY